MVSLGVHKNHMIELAGKPCLAQRCRGWLGAGFLIFGLSIVPALSATVLAAAGETASGETVKTEKDILLLGEAIKHAKKGDHDLAAALTPMIDDPVALDLVEWLFLSDKDTKPDFDRLNAFLVQHPDWPNNTTLRRAMEQALFIEPRPANITLSVFAQNPPLSGEGKAALAQAQLETGNIEAGHRLIEEAWTGHSFSKAHESLFFERYGEHLTRNGHARRMSRLLYLRQNTAALRVAKKLGPDFVALAKARIALRSRSGSVDRRLAAVPDYLKTDPGLLYDRARWHRKKGNDHKARYFLTLGPQNAYERVMPVKWWVEQHIIIRHLLEEGHPFDAYQLAAAHSLDPQTDYLEYSEAEFLAGWIALRHLSRPEQALAHFEALREMVNSPISQARGDYWIGRAYRAQNQHDLADYHFQRAAHFPLTYYGQLAQVEVAPGEPLVLPEPTIIAGVITANEFNERSTIRAIRLLHKTENQELLEKFAYHLSRLYHDPSDFVLLAELTYELGYSHLGLRVAKKAMAKHIFMPELTHPLDAFPEPAYLPHGLPIERALALSLARQESEFNPDAISQVGARGLMQLMPKTAYRTAKRHHIPYNKNNLTKDPSYNVSLGMAYLSDLLEKLSGSYIMAIAAYNAGTGNLNRWLKANGDPRHRSIDAIDWVESISYSETRNYVQRVMENIQVYRARLSKSLTVLAIAQDLNRHGTTQFAVRAPRTRQPRR